MPAAKTATADPVMHGIRGFFMPSRGASLFPPFLLACSDVSPARWTENRLRRKYRKAKRLASAPVRFLAARAVSVSAEEAESPSSAEYGYASETSAPEVAGLSKREGKTDILFRMSSRKDFIIRAKEAKMVDRSNPWVKITLAALGAYVALVCVWHGYRALAEAAMAANARRIALAAEEAIHSAMGAFSLRAEERERPDAIVAALRRIESVCDPAQGRCAMLGELSGTGFLAVLPEGEIAQGDELVRLTAKEAETLRRDRRVTVIEYAGGRPLRHDYQRLNTREDENGQTLALRVTTFATLMMGTEKGERISCWALVSGAVALSSAGWILWRSRKREGLFAMAG